MPTSRIEAFSDKSFAIIITLLILEIHVPQVKGPDISGALQSSRPQIFHADRIKMGLVRQFGDCGIPP